MSNQIWNNSDYSEANNGDILCNNKQSVHFCNIVGKKRQVSHNKNDKVKNASVEFSDNMRRDIASIQQNNVANKQQCVVIHNSTTEIDSLLEMEKYKQIQSMSVSSISGLTPVTDNTTSSSIIQCSENFKQMQQNVRLEEKQNKSRIKSFVKKMCLKISSLY